MPLANQALVLVTDGRKTLYFRNHGDHNQIDLRTEAHDQRDDAPNRDPVGDAPGTNRQAGGYGHSTYQETAVHQLEEDRWARSAADEINKRALSGDFETLAIIAAPRTLGELRKKLHKESARRVVCEIAKEMIGHTIADIEKLIVAQTRAGDLPAM